MNKELGLFDAFSDDQRICLFECLLHSIESGSGIGFRNEDPLHMDYSDGAEEREPPDGGETEKQNLLFPLMQELSLWMCEHQPTLMHKDYTLTTWPELCKAAQKFAENPEKTYTPIYKRTTE